VSLSVGLFVCFLFMGFKVSCLGFFFPPLCGFILGFLAWVVFLFVFVGYIRVACLGCFVFVFLGYIRVACLGCCF